MRAVFGLSDVYPVHRRDASSECNQFKGMQIDPNVIKSKYHNVAAPKNGRRPGFGKHSQGIAAFEDAEFLQSEDWFDQFSAEACRVVALFKGFDHILLGG